MRKIQLTYEDAEFNLLQADKEALSAALDKPLNWEKYFMYLKKNGKRIN